MSDGVNAVDSVLHFLLFDCIPMLLDLPLTFAYVTMFFDMWMGMLLTITMAAYLSVIMVAKTWHEKFRKRYFDICNEQNAMEMDALLNFETVKHHANEAFELGRYKRCIQSIQVCIL